MVLLKIYKTVFSIKAYCITQVITFFLFMIYSKAFVYSKLSTLFTHNLGVQITWEHRRYKQYPARITPGHDHTRARMAPHLHELAHGAHHTDSHNPHDLPRHAALKGDKVNYAAEFPELVEGHSQDTNGHSHLEVSASLKPSMKWFYLFLCYFCKCIKEYIRY